MPPCTPDNAQYATLRTLAALPAVVFPEKNIKRCVSANGQVSVSRSVLYPMVCFYLHTSVVERMKII